MTWTALVDRTTGTLITAAIWNQSLGLNGNLSETAAAKVTTAGDLVVGSGPNTLARLAAPAVGQVLKGAGVGVAPVWGQVVSAEITPLNVTTGKLADLGVTTAKIADGAVTAAKLANQRRAVVNKTGSQMIPNALADTALTWEAEISDPDGWHSTSSNTSRITVAAAGLVVVRCSVVWGSTNAGATHLLKVRKNGTTHLAQVQNCHNIGGTTFFSTQDITIENVAAAGDYYEILAAHSGAGDCAVGQTDSGTTLNCVFSVVQQNGAG